MQLNANSTAESYYGFRCPAMYNALRRFADGLKDADTGEYDGISSAYDVEGVPAFIAPDSGGALVTNTVAGDRKAQ
jgi:hypothetical protein